jgi:formylglycine-generating enzyme required for sulfatase activity
MADIFLSYAKEDRAAAERLSHALEQSGRSVWWDRELLAGADFYKVIARELRSARCVIVIWSNWSADSHWVRDEAREGLERNVLVPVLIEPMEPPMGFGSIHAENLSDWTGEADHPGFVRLTEAIAGLVDGGDADAHGTGEQDLKLSGMSDFAGVAGRLAPRGKRLLSGMGRWRRTVVVAAMIAALFGLAIAASELIDWKDETPRRPIAEIRPDLAGMRWEPFRDCPECPEMVPLLPGRFRMGASWLDREAQSDERPTRTITIDYPFAIGKYEVTFDEWQACVSAGGCKRYAPDDSNWGRERQPVIFVSWQDAHAYLDWLREKTGKDYRLPSESEWEFACRAGTKTRYPFGEAISPALANYDRNEMKSREVGSYPANPWGLHDMNGNVWEWTEDIWHDSHRGRPTDGSPRVEGKEPENRVIRGGSWDDRPRRARCISRNRKDLDARENEIGFRVALPF